MQLRALFVQMCWEIMEHMCHQVVTNMAVHVSQCAQQKAGYTEHVILTGYVSMNCSLCSQVYMYHYINIKAFISISNRVSLHVPPYMNLGARGSVVVKALCYKPEGRGFETR
jgi:hypothetical protein